MTIVDKIKEILDYINSGRIDKARKMIEDLIQTLEEVD